MRYWTRNPVASCLAGVLTLACLATAARGEPGPDVALNFANDIVPIFTRFGCNAGGCHGKSGGQNGFALSLLGFEPEEDYEYVVKESRGRRIIITAPEASLLLMKASGQMPHGGGAKLPSDSPHYRILKR